MGLWTLDVLTSDDLSKELLWSISKERDTAHQEFIQDDAHSPPVHRLPVTLTENHLWGDVLRGSTHLEGQTKFLNVFNSSLLIWRSPRGENPACFWLEIPAKMKGPLRVFICDGLANRCPAAVTWTWEIMRLQFKAQSSCSQWKVASSKREEVAITAVTLLFCAAC